MISWVYWIGVGEEASKAYRKSENTASKQLGKALAIFSGGGPLAVLAVTGSIDLLSPNIGDNVQYWIGTYINDQHYLLGSGNGVSAYGRIEKPTQGGFYIKLLNDNFRRGIDVDVKVGALVVTDHYVKKTVTYPQYKPITEIQHERIPSIRKVEIPMCAGLRQRATH